MTRTQPEGQDTVSFLHKVQSAAFVAAVVAELTLLVGGWIGLHCAFSTASVPGWDGDLTYEHTLLAVGVAITVLSVVVALLAAGASWLLFSYALPRLAALQEQASQDAEALATKTW
jgi:hypothetical protein